MFSDICKLTEEEKLKKDKYIKEQIDALKEDLLVEDNFKKKNTSNVSYMTKEGE